MSELSDLANDILNSIEAEDFSYAFRNTMFIRKQKASDFREE